jgi:hypothetical protein
MPTRLTASRPNLFALTIAALLASAAAPPSDAATVVSNLGEGDLGDAIVGISGAEFQLYQSFVAGSDVVLDSATLRMRDTVGGSPGFVFLELLADNSGTPGAVLASLGSNLIDSPAEFTFNAPAGTNLFTGTPYWLHLTGDANAAGWTAARSTAETGDPGWSIGDSSLSKQVGIVTNTLPPLKFRLDASPQITSPAAPTPAAATAGLTLFSTLMLKRRRTSTPA